MVKEEMRRTIAYLVWKGKRWGELGDETDTEIMSFACRRGMIAFAKRQAYIQKNLARIFSGLWAPIVQECGLDCDWGIETDQQDQQDVGSSATLASRPIIRSSIGGRGLFDPFRDTDTADSDDDTAMVEFGKSARRLEESIDEETAF